MVHPQVWNNVPYQEVLEAIRAADKSEDRHSDRKTEVGQEDEVLVLLLVQWAAWQEVVNTTITILSADTLAFRLLLMVVVASDVLEQVQWPARELLPNKMGRSEDWSLLEQLVHLVE